MSQKDYTGALVLYKRAVDNYANKPEAEEFAAETTSRLGSTYLRLAEEAKRVEIDVPKTEVSTSYFEASRLAFERVVRDFPKQTEWVAEAKMQLMALKLESALFGKAKYADAQVLAEQFLADYPADMIRTPTVRLIRAESLFHQNRLEDSVTEIGVIQRDSPSSGQPYGTSQFLLGQCYGRMREFDKAIEAYRKFLGTVTVSFSAWEERPGAQYYIGLCLDCAGRKDEAIRELAQVKVQYPNSYFVEMAEQTMEPIISGGKS